jgi:hypothetical protein
LTASPCAGNFCLSCPLWFLAEPDLVAYANNPYANDNLGVLGKWYDDRIIAGRVKHLVQEILELQKQLEECERINGYAEIDVKTLKGAVNAVLDHLIDDLGLEKVKIEEGTDHYWHCPASEIHDMSKKPIGLDIGSLGDDVDS